MITKEYVKSLVEGRLELESLMIQTAKDYLRLSFEPFESNENEWEVNVEHEALNIRGNKILGPEIAIRAVNRKTGESRNVQIPLAYLWEIEWRELQWCRPQKLTAK